MDKEGFLGYRCLALGFQVAGARVLPPILGRLLSGTFWLALARAASGRFLALDDAARARSRSATCRMGSLSSSPGGSGSSSSCSSSAPARLSSGRSPMPGRAAITTQWTARSPVA